ncbi:MAG: hypothetical protein HPY82_03375 [Gammaproteobacteria bacterium]|nr:hypothetical protein [Gammaproteobacteria bacterium]
MAKTQHLSIRLTESDHRKIKDISRRLGVKESDLFRFIVKKSLNKLLPFQDEDIKGADLIPALMECGQDLVRYLDLDSEQLDHIVNEGVLESERKVDKADLDILIMAGSSDHCALIKLSAITRQPIEKENLLTVMKDYLTAKYMHAFKLIEDLKKEPSIKPGTAINSPQVKENQYA